MVVACNWHFRNPASVVLNWEKFKYNSLFGAKFDMRISYYLNTYSFLCTDLFFYSSESCTVSKMFFLSFLLPEISLCHVKPFCLGGSPKLHCLSVTNFGLPCLLYIVCETCSFVLGYFFLVFLSVQLIFTPATTVAAVQSDIPVVSSSSSSCQSAATQVSLSSFVMWNEVQIFRLKIDMHLCLNYWWFQCSLSYISDCNLIKYGKNFKKVFFYRNYNTIKHGYLGYFTLAKMSFYYDSMFYCKADLFLICEMYSFV